MRFHRADGRPPRYFQLSANPVSVRRTWTGEKLFIDYAGPTIGLTDGTIADAILDRIMQRLCLRLGLTWIDPFRQGFARIVSPPPGLRQRDGRIYAKRQYQQIGRLSRDV